MSSSRPAGRWRRAVVGLALLASPVLVACGDDGGQPTDAPASSQPGDGGGGNGDGDGGGNGGGNEDEPDENEPDEDEPDEG